MFTALVSVVASTNYDTRRFTAQANAVSMGNCSFTGVINSRHRFDFGTSYVFNLTTCKIGSCYAIIDETYKEEWAYVYGLRPSIFREFQIVGASSFNLSSAGVYFRPETENITLEFTIQTCNDFYKLHPFAHPQNCTAGVAVTGPLNGPPLCGDDVRYMVETWK